MVAEKQRLEVTWQSVLGAILVSSIIAASYPYIVLKVGMGPNVSVVGAFFGAIVLRLIAQNTRGQNRYMNNLIQTAATSASCTAFMCVIGAACYYISDNPKAGVTFSIPPFQMFIWLTLSGWIGVLFTTLFRRAYLDDPEMVFADGVAAAETVETLDETGPGSKNKVSVLGLGALCSGCLAWFRDVKELISPIWVASPFRIGFEYNLLSIGSGMLISLRVALSMLAGSMLVWLVIGPWLVDSGIAREIALSTIMPDSLAKCQEYVVTSPVGKEEIAWAAKNCASLFALQKQQYFGLIVKWNMWPATALMLTAALMSLILKWRTLARTFTSLNASTAVVSTDQDISPRTVFVLGGILTALLAVTQHAFFGASVMQTVVAVLGSLVLMLVGIRVLGETNQGPVSLMANGLQALFAVFWKDQMVLNLVSAGTAGNISAQGEGLMQDYKAGRIIGSTPRVMTWFQFGAVPIGAAAVAIMFPLLVAKYGIGGEHGLSAPTGIKLANMAVLLSGGADALPSQALLWTALAGAIGVILALADHFLKWPWIPSAAAFGFALILPGELSIMMAVGGIVGYLWLRLSPATHARYVVIVASGFIAGEAMLSGVIAPVLAALGWK